MGTFPDGFLFGTAQSAHQVEGGNVNSDWWAWENAPGTPCVESSGDACDVYHRYRDDIVLMQRLALRHRVGANRARGGRVLAGGARPLSSGTAQLPRAWARGDRDLPSLHTASLVAGEG